MRPKYMRPQKYKSIKWAVDLFVGIKLLICRND